MPAALLLAACIAGLPAPVFAQTAQPSAAAPPKTASRLVDPDFGVRARHLGLERQVEMYQWREEGGRYLRAWSTQPLDSSAFAPGHANPPFPIHGQRWMASDVRVDGVPLDARVLEQLGEWTQFRPSFNALPGNLTATFQPEGSGLGSAENPLAPQVGDLRIHWRALALPPLQDRIELRAGRWQLRPGTTPDPAQAASVAQPVDARTRKRVPWWIFLGGLVPVWVALAMLWRRRRHKQA